MLDRKLYLLQRLSALALVPFIIVHLAVMMIAVQDGLTSAEILARTRASSLWFWFYAAFVVTVSLHAAIGLRVVVHENLRLGGRGLAAFTLLAGFALLVLGIRAVLAVSAP